MTNVLPFTPKVTVGDWTAVERAQLLDLAERLAEARGPVEGVFGQTDAGDPWYVVTDDRHEVLVHVARIDGGFVIHDAAVDVFRQVGSLWSAVRQVLAGGVGEDRGAVVVALNPQGREAQSFLSLVIAVGLYLEMHGLGLGNAALWSGEAAPHDDRSSRLVPAGDLIASLSQDAERAAVHGALAGTSHPDAPVAAAGKAAAPHAVADVAASAAAPGLAVFKGMAWAPLVPASAPSEAGALPAPAPSSPADVLGLAGSKAVQNGTAGDDVLVGGSGGDTLRGGGGDDYLDGAGAGAGEVDRLDGGAGDDRIVMGERVVATGGAGGDAFLITAPAAAKIATLLGVVLDFSVPEGDRLVFDAKTQVSIVNVASVADVLGEAGITIEASGATPTGDAHVAVAGTRIGFDFNSDGAEDAFILLGGVAATAFRIGPVTATEGAHAGPVVVELVGLAGHPAAPVASGNLS